MSNNLSSGKRLLLGLVGLTKTRSDLEWELPEVGQTCYPAGTSLRSGFLSFVILPFDRPEIVATDEKPTSSTKVKTIVGHLSSDSQFEPATDKTGKSLGGQRLDDLWLALLKNGALYTETIWSQPILFRPNGESQDARLVIRDKVGNTIELTVRGLTGGVRVERMRRPEVQP